MYMYVAVIVYKFNEPTPRDLWESVIGLQSVCLTGDGDTLEVGEHIDITIPSSATSSGPYVPTPKFLDGVHSLAVETSQSKGIVLTIQAYIMCLGLS